jgi:transmembrane sensor
MHGPANGTRGRQASDWLVKLRDDELSSEQIAGWLEWSQAHPDNLRAFEQVKGLMREVKGLDAARRRQALERLLPQPVPRARRLAPALRHALAAGILVSLGVGGYLLWQQHVRLQPFDGTYTTGTAEDRAFTLPDGTRVELGAGSRLHVRYTAEARRLELADGEAFFRTDTDARRPFLVTAGPWRLTDIGTAFNVRKTGEHLVVTVTEGIVDVAPAAPVATGESAPPLRLLAGEQAVMTQPEQSPPAVARVEPASATSWIQGQLRFSDEPLAVVVANLNRYAGRQIVLADPALADLRFSGTVLTGNVEGWLEAACRVFSLRQQPGDDNHVLLYPQAPAVR